MKEESPPKGPYVEFAYRIRELLGESNNSPEVARKLECSDETVYAWRRGSQLPSGKNLLTLVKLYPDISIDKLLTGKENKGKSESVNITITDMEALNAHRELGFILESNDSDTIFAIKQNLHSFSESVRRRDKIHFYETGIHPPTNPKKKTFKIIEKRGKGGAQVISLQGYKNKMNK
jgi:hypothetical protein